MTVRTVPDLLREVRALCPQVAAGASLADQHGDLPPSVITAMKAAGVFRMTMPLEAGGLEADPLTQIEVLELLSHADASAGWVAMIGSDGGYYSAFLEPAVSAELYADVDAVTAGFPQPAGAGVERAGGYSVTGRWPFGSGCRHADWLASGFTVTGSRAGPDGRPEWRVAMLPAGGCVIGDDWDALGLRATGSHSYTAQQAQIPREHTFSFTDPPRYDGVLYRFPAMFLVNVVAVPLGTARAALDCLVSLTHTRTTSPSGSPMREEPRVQGALARAEAEVGSARSYALDCVGDLWQTLQRGDYPSRRQRALLRLSAAHAFRTARDSVTNMVDVAGTSAIYASSPLQRQLRDLVTMNQHVIASARMVEACGQLLLGSEPGIPLV